MPFELYESLIYSLQYSLLNIKKDSGDKIDSYINPYSKSFFLIILENLFIFIRIFDNYYFY